ncbi:disulfide bond formation protein DsbB [Malonomonas rubra DSM 5091]|uniref:Disulfide bond formation protein DsbB n=1 Tax=Malonomonas rubra DSM 5091 TaxID=1122189 RepID=A0A1M6N835_MALRU|nr:disulfide bond formation protein B [Malonomonas rubra]SHJ91706.1 disulfide bond formation protein DsbB [Malonomonas rubra DSM 5091]
MSHPDKTKNTNWTLLFLCWLLVSVSATISIFFSSVLEYQPCVLCWYQRICLFPLIFIFAAGLFPAFDKSVIKYALPLTIAGGLTALYHTLLYAGIIPENIQPCSQGVSCTEKYFELFGFISIPMMSFFAFSFLTALLIILKRRTSK